MLTPLAAHHNYSSQHHMSDMVDGIEFIQMDSRAPSSLIGLVTKPSFKTDDFLAPHPNHDYYNHRFSFPSLVYSALCGTGATSALLLVALRIQDVRPLDVISPYASLTFTLFFMPPLPILIGYLGFCVLLSLVFEISTPKNKTYRIWCRLLHFFIFVVILLLPSFSYTFVLVLSWACPTLYLVMSVVHTVRRSFSRKPARKSKVSCSTL